MVVLNFVTSVDLSKRAVGSDGSGSTSSGCSVILPEGERNAPSRRRRAASALGDSVMDRAYVGDRILPSATIDKASRWIIVVVSEYLVALVSLLVFVVCGLLWCVQRVMDW